MAPQPEVFYCAAKAELMDQFARAIEELARLHQDLTAALITSDPDYERFESRIQAARERKNEARTALLAHSQEHGC